MNVRATLGASLALTLLMGCVVAEDSLKSGPQVGKNLPGPFHPLNVTGSQKGQKFCQV